MKGNFNVYTYIVISFFYKSAPTNHVIWPFSYPGPSGDIYYSVYFSQNCKFESLEIEWTPSSFMELMNDIGYLKI